ncbi:putative colanic acid biosynthesis acetyltransferase [Bradyrhizobium sp. DN5]|uniref:putative colanic acid biosynthesis acetyltransferase n=1 Tax=Bradyrhizobium sp. DN5 TaxID=3056950 RepID=UPI00352498DF
MLLDASQNKPLEGGPSFSLGNRLFRVLWGVSWILLARWTPPPFHRWRRSVLIIFGAKIHKSARIHASVRIWYPPYLEVGEHATIGPRVNCYCQDRIRIGDRAIVSQGAHLCAGSHDISDRNFQLTTRPIVIEDWAWLAAECFIGPGVTVGEGAVLGARGVAFRNLQAWTVYAGNPAQKIKDRILRAE